MKRKAVYMFKAFRPSGISTLATGFALGDKANITILLSCALMYDVIYVISWYIKLHIDREQEIISIFGDYLTNHSKALLM